MAVGIHENNTCVSDDPHTWTVLERSIGQGLKIFLFSAVSRPSLEPTQLPIHWVPVVMRLKREADQSLPSSAGVEDTSTPPYAFAARCLVKHRDNFTFTLTLMRDVALLHW